MAKRAKGIYSITGILKFLFADCRMSVVGADLLSSISLCIPFKLVALLMSPRLSMVKVPLSHCHNKSFVFLRMKMDKWLRFFLFVQS